MEITEQKSAEVVTLRLSGRLDTTTARAFEKKILGQIESGERHVVIDLAQLDYISSAGLRVIVLAAKRLSAANGKRCCARSRIGSEKCSISRGFRPFSPFTAPTTTPRGVCRHES
jgi:anti-anti-sigma factor